ncbi:peptidoglycan DD-metalloendopeptidase family protein [Spirochaetota bacterium]
MQISHKVLKLSAISALSLIFIISAFIVYSVFMPGTLKKAYKHILSKSKNFKYDEQGGPYNPFPYLRVLEYKVKPGECLWGIQDKTGIRIDTIVSFNKLNAKLKSVHMIKAGQSLKIPNKDGILYEIRSNDTANTISKSYSVDKQTIMSFNKIKESEIIGGKHIFIPGAMFSVLERAKKLNTEFWKPLKQIYITQGFGFRIHPITKKADEHQGIDMRAYVGTKVYASKPGRITFAGIKYGYGKVVIIQHKNGYSTRYAHLSRYYVRKGEKVTLQQPIGEVGSTGMATGSHLHFEVRRYGKPIDPRLITDLH